MGDPKLPADVDGVARALGVSEVRQHDVAWDGRLVRDAGHWIIECKSSAPLARTRFTIAHECGHLVRRTELQHVPLTTRETEERFANAFAAAVLLPPCALRSVVGNRGPSLETLLIVAEAAGVSATAAFLALRRHEGWPSVLLRMRRTEEGWTIVTGAGIAPIVTSGLTALLPEGRPAEPGPPTPTSECIVLLTEKVRATFTADVLQHRRSALALVDAQALRAMHASAPEDSWESLWDDDARAASEQGAQKE